MFWLNKNIIWYKLHDLVYGMFGELKLKEVYFFKAKGWKTFEKREWNFHEVKAGEIAIVTIHSVPCLNLKKFKKLTHQLTKNIQLPR